MHTAMRNTNRFGALMPSIPSDVSQIHIKSHFVSSLRAFLLAHNHSVLWIMLIYRNFKFKLLDCIQYLVLQRSASESDISILESKPYNFKSIC